MKKTLTCSQWQWLQGHRCWTRHSWAATELWTQQKKQPRTQGSHHSPSSSSASAPRAAGIQQRTPPATAERRRPNSEAPDWSPRTAASPSGSRFGCWETAGSRSPATRSSSFQWRRGGESGAPRRTSPCRPARRSSGPWVTWPGSAPAPEPSFFGNPCKGEGGLSVVEAVRNGVEIRMWEEKKRLEREWWTGGWCSEEGERRSREWSIIPVAVAPQRKYN